MVVAERLALARWARLCAPHESPHRSVVQDGAYRPIDLIEVVSCVYYLCGESTIAVLTE